MLRSGLLFGLVCGCLVVLFGVIGALGLNEALFVTLNHAAELIPSWFWAHWSLLADGTVALALLSLFAFKYPTFTTLGLWGGAGLGVLTQIIKRITDIPRPAGVLPHDIFRIIGDPLLANAFPSGHSVTALLFTACLIFYFRPKLWIALLILAAGLMAAFSRIAVGAHWPLDVLAGATLGWTGGYLLMRFYAHRVLVKWARIAALIITLLAIPALFVADTHLPQVTVTVHVMAGMLMINAAYHLYQMYRQQRSQ